MSDEDGEKELLGKFRGMFWKACAVRANYMYLVGFVLLTTGKPTVFACVIK